MNTKHNFGAGPGILPKEVLEKSAEAVLNWDGIGLSLLEVSHRTKKFEDVIAEACALAKELLGVGDNYEALFLQGGASTQFAMIPFNFLGDNETAHYLDTGVWANKAIKEAKLFGNVNVIASSKSDNYNFIPKDYENPKEGKYFHITSNNTIYGTQLQNFPKSTIPLICDMSSDIFSRPVNGNDFAMIYAGAQKNMGPAGATLVVYNKDLLKRADRKIPSMFDYNVHVEGESMYNTPPVFSIFVSLLTLRWIKSIGLDGMLKRNTEKADTLYNEIDRNALFKGTCKIEDRSKMNVCFVMENPELEKDFLTAAEAAGCIGLKGHRSVGGFRASIYNALELSSVKVLVDVMKEFELKNIGSASISH